MKKEKLQAIRKQQGYTQQEVADFIATDVSNYSRKESGDVRIFPEEWQKISMFLKVPIEDIYEDDPFKLPVNNKIQNTEINKESIYLSIINNLQDYIALLKEENQRLKK